MLKRFIISMFLLIVSALSALAGYYAVVILGLDSGYNFFGISIAFLVSSWLLYFFLLTDL